MRYSRIGILRHGRAMEPSGPSPFSLQANFVLRSQLIEKTLNGCARERRQHLAKIGQWCADLGIVV